MAVTMPATRYGPVLANRRVRMLLVVGFLLRIPMFGVAVVLTLHVVQSLHRSWAQAGLVAAVATLAIAISGPWRGRLLDTIGLRRVVAPSILVTAACWCVAPFATYWVLLILAAIAGLFAVPSFTIVRQALVTMTRDADRRSALALDAVIIELAFMIGPLLGVTLATAYPTAWVIFGLEMATAVCGVMLWVLNPPMQRAKSRHADDEGQLPRSAWMTKRFIAVCLVGFAAVIVLNSCDVAFVAAAKELGVPNLVGVIMSVWGLGSLIGGLAYGAMARPPRLLVLLLLLALTTVALGVASNVCSLSALAFGAGLFCAPTMASAYDAMTRVVPERVRGEASGWYGSAQTLGGALAAPVAGVSIDQVGAWGGFVTGGLVGLVAAIAGLVLLPVRRRRRARRS